MWCLLQRHPKLSLRPNRPDLLIEEITSLLSVKRDIVVPQHLGEDQPQLSVCQVLANAVPHAHRPRLECRPVVDTHCWVILVEVALWDELVGLCEVVVGVVCAQVAEANAHLLPSV